MVKRLPIEDCQKEAEKRHGECLSKIYINNSTKLEWKCELGHIWEACLSSIKSGTWCAHCCKNKKLNMEICKNMAKVKGGKCLSKKYINKNIKMLWECKYTHQWMATAGSVRNGHWCPYCANNVKLTIEICKKIANDRGGKCLSEEYKNASTNLKWECEDKHIWENNLDKIKNNNQWCPICSKNKAQKELTNIIKEIYPNSIIKNNYRKLKWLVNPETNYKMEIDIIVFNNDFLLAIEYDGEQHFKPVCFGGISEERARNNLKEAKRRDKIKNKLMSEHKSEVPFFVRFNYKEDLTIDYVKNKLIKYGVIINE